MRQMRIDVKMCGSFKKSRIIFLFLLMPHPDGDTLGWLRALPRAYQMGKKARVINADEIPAKYSYLYKWYVLFEFQKRIMLQQLM